MSGGHSQSADRGDGSGNDRPDTDAGGASKDPRGRARSGNAGVARSTHGQHSDVNADGHADDEDEVPSCAGRSSDGSDQSRALESGWGVQEYASLDECVEAERLRLPRWCAWCAVTLFCSMHIIGPAALTLFVMWAVMCYRGANAVSGARARARVCVCVCVFVCVPRRVTANPLFALLARGAS